MQITTQSQAIDLVTNGKIQISCRSKIEADKVCALFPKAKNTYDKDGYAYLSNYDGQFDVHVSMDLPTLTAKKFLSFPKEEKPETPKYLKEAKKLVDSVTKPKSLNGGWCVKNDGSQEFKEVMNEAIKKMGKGIKFDFDIPNGYYGISKGRHAIYSNFTDLFNNNILTLSELKELIDYKPKVMTANDCVSGEWYVMDSVYKWLNKFDRIVGDELYASESICLDIETNYKNQGYTTISNIKSIRPATREEVIKYFPNEFDAPKVDEPTPEQFLAKCKEMYPIGTKTKNLISQNIYTIASDNFVFGKNDNIMVEIKEVNRDNEKFTCVWLLGKFAEIISLPERPEQREIDGYVAPITCEELHFKKGDKFTKRMQGGYATGEYPKVYINEEVVKKWQPYYKKTEAEIQADLITELINDFINHSDGQSLETFSKSQSKFTIKRK